MNATKIDQRPKCCECGSYNVETTAWVDYRPDGTIAIVPGEGPHDDESGNWCHDCEEHVHLDYPDFTPEDRAAVAAADRAREAGPELLETLRDLVARVRVYEEWASRERLADPKFNPMPCHEMILESIRKHGALDAATAAIAKAEGRDET